ncbi:hypothetical protein ACQ4PT_064844 [Festuca glaucescens]
MGLLALNRLISMQKDRRRRRIRASSMSIALMAKRKGSPCQKEDYSEGSKRVRSSVPDLPQEIWHDIHSLLPLRDAARAGCVSHAFLDSWRWHPNLTLNPKTLGLSGQNFINKVDQIMKKHSGIGIKSFKLHHYGSRIHASKLNNWLQIAVTPEIHELELSLPTVGKAQLYNFPCPLLFAGSAGNRIRDLQLANCAFHPVAGLGCLTRLYLSNVHITGDELRCLLSNSFALEELSLNHCSEIMRLKIPCLLHRFTNLTVFDCRALGIIENEAPNLCTVLIDTDIVHKSIGYSLQVKRLEMFCAVEFNLVHHVRAKLPASMPNLGTLSISSAGEMFSTPSVPGKFLLLKHLDICLEVAIGAFSPDYDYFSLAFFLDACPILENFNLDVIQTRMRHDSIFEDSSHLRQMVGHRHDNIKTLKITGFCSAKSMVELTCHIVENATSLECLTLDTISENGLSDNVRLSMHEIGECPPICRHMIGEAQRALLAMERYIVGKVPSTVKLNIKKPCSWCHAR